MNKEATIRAVMESLDGLRVIGGDMSLEPIRKEVEKYLNDLPEEGGRTVILLYAQQVNIECPQVHQSNQRAAKLSDVFETTKGSDVS